jgi:Transposase family tnp2
MLIPEPRDPNNDIDVYLAPLIDESKELWEVGIIAYDSSKKEEFQLRATILWTINDFSAYAMLSGWSTKGYIACPICGKDTDSHRLQKGSKNCYMGHRRFFPIKHRIPNIIFGKDPNKRKSRKKKTINNKTRERKAYFLSYLTGMSC